MKRTIIIAASAVTLAAGIAGSHYLSGQSPMRSSRWKRHRKSGKKNPKTAAGRKKTAAVLQRRQLPTALLPLRYRQQARQPPMSPFLRFGRVFPKGKTADNPEDNIFEINLSRTIPSDARVWLCYELQGADHSEP